MSLSKTQKGILLGAVFMISATASADDGEGVAESTRGVAESLASIRDSIAISVLHITNSPTISGSVIEAKSFGEGSSVRFDFAKNEICNVSTSQKGKEVKSCWPMGTLSAHNRERLRDVSCAHAEAAPAADFTAKYCR